MSELEADRLLEGRRLEPAGTMRWRVRGIPGLVPSVDEADRNLPTRDLASSGWS